jgi:hypothetical protein
LYKLATLGTEKCGRNGQLAGLFKYANGRKSGEINEKEGGKGLTTDTSDAHNHYILITFVINCIILNKYFNEKYCFIMTQ